MFRARASAPLVALHYASMFASSVYYLWVNAQDLHTHTPFEIEGTAVLNSSRNLPTFR